MEPIPVTKFVALRPVAAILAAALCVAGAVSAQAEVRDHRGQPRLYAPPKPCKGKYCAPGTFHFPDCTPDKGTNPHCRDHRS